MARRESEFQSLKTVLRDRRQDLPQLRSTHIETVAARILDTLVPKLDAALCYFCYRRKLVDTAEAFWLDRFSFAKFIMYAVIETGGKQYQVAAGDQVEIERIPAEEGSSVTFDRVLMLCADGSVRMGTPTVETATVVADVVSHQRGPKVTTFKMKRRKGYHRTKGHRQNLTVVKIKEING